MAITVVEGLLPKELACLFRRWKHTLLRGARNLEALSIWANAAPCPPVLGSLPKLRFLEITLFYNSHDWLDGLFDDLGFCYSLESLRITQAIPREAVAVSGKLPEVQLSTLPNLKRVELVQWFPDLGFSLPPECELYVTVSSVRFAIEKQWDDMQRHLRVLALADIGFSGPQGWLVGFERLSRLQFFSFKGASSVLLDLAELKAIPHVEVHIDGDANLTLSDGTWQTLQVCGKDGLCINFTDAEAFVRGTQRFLFVSLGDAATSQPMCASIREACSRQAKSCYQCGYMGQWEEDPYTVRLSNCEEMMRLQPLHGGRMTPSGGLHDGYAGTPEDSPLWHWNCLGDRRLVRQEQFWPKWEPHQWVFGR